MKKKNKAIFLAIVFITMTLPMLGLIFNVKNKNVENRQLQEFPEYNLDFTKNFEGYWQEQFPFRNHFITAYNLVNQSLFNLSGNDKVVYGQDGFLYLAETTKDYQNSIYFSQAELGKIESYFNLINERLKENAIDLHVMVVPNKNTIYPEYMPDNIKKITDNDNLDNFYKIDFPFNNINLKEKLLAEKKEQDDFIYHKEDSHYNNLGAAFTHSLILKELGLKAETLLDKDYKINKDFQGDLTTILYPASEKLDYNMDFDLQTNYIFARPLGSFDDLQIETISKSENPSLYMIRDSFARALIPMLSNDFSKVTYSRVIPYYIEEVIKAKPANLLIEIAERNMYHWLKTTPIMEMKPIDISFDGKAKKGEDLLVKYSNEEKHKLHHLNIKVENQSLAKTMEEVFLIDGNGDIYPAFPVYERKDLDKIDITYGFSLYTGEKLKLDQAKVIYKIDGKYLESNIIKMEEE